MAAAPLESWLQSHETPQPRTFSEAVPKLLMCSSYEINDPCSKSLGLVDILRSHQELIQVLIPDSEMLLKKYKIHGRSVHGTGQTPKDLGYSTSETLKEVRKGC